jgi:hypothetical protein
MASQGFIDLDELILLCRNEKAKSFIQEAVQCYKSGSYRQAIVATWIAVVYDVIHKLQELELAGDANAVKVLERYEKIRQAGDLKGSLDFERDILGIAKKDFELISDIEYIDLARLQEDRNRCAHPALNAFDEVYQPSAELARTHLRNAIEHLLQRPPVQGKAALARLMLDIESEYFPVNKDEAIKYFSAGALGRAKASLVRNFAIILIKGLLDSDIDPRRRVRLYAAFNATVYLHSGITQATLADKLNDIVVQLADENLIEALRFTAEIPNAWGCLNDAAKSRIRTLVENLPLELEAVGIYNALRISDLEQVAIDHLSLISHTSLRILVSWGIERPEVLARAIDLYKNSTSFDMANSIGSGLIIPLAKLIPPAEVEKIIEACASNHEIIHSYERNAVLKHLRSCEIIPINQFDALLAQYGTGNISL